jgi:integrase
MAYKLDTVAGRSKLAPRREPYWLPIGDLNGAYVGFRRGPDTWIVRIYEDGLKRYHQLGRFEDHRAAIRAARDWVKARDCGVTEVNATVGDACRAYLSNLESDKGVTAAQEARGRLQRCVLGRSAEEARKARAKAVKPHPISRKPLNKLRAEDIKAWRNALVQEGLEAEPLRKARASANRELSTLIAALNYARQGQMVESASAWTSVRKFADVQAERHKTRRELPISDRKALLQAAATVGSGAIRPFLEALLLTGARPVELCRATVADYNRKTGTLALYSYKGRSPEKKIRNVPLRVLGAEALIKGQVAGKLPNAPLFTRDDGRPWGHSDWDHLVREAREAAGLRTLTAYDLRHCFISEAIAGGVDPLTVARIAGTSLEQINRTYGQLLEERAAKAFANVKLI